MPESHHFVTTAATVVGSAANAAGKRRDRGRPLGHEILLPLVRGLCTRAQICQKKDAGETIVEFWRESRDPELGEAVHLVQTHVLNEVGELASPRRVLVEPTNGRDAARRSRGR